MMRVRLSSLLFVFVASCTAMQPVKSATIAAPPLPNIIIVLADDLGVADLSFGDPDAKIQTPELDRLARDGMRFSDAHSSSSVCTPTRYSLLTGRYSWRTRLKSRVIDGFGEALVAPGRDTIADLLARAGYQTAMFGKWHLGLDWPLKDGGTVDGFRGLKANETDRVDYSKPFRNGPVDAGFQTFYGINASLDFFPYVWLEGDRTVSRPTDRQKKLGGKDDKQAFMRSGPKASDFNPEAVMATLTSKTVDYIGSQDGTQPFFVYLSLAAPHTPVIPAAQFRGTSKAGIYGDYVREIDGSIGQIVAALEERGMLENTIIVFTADNGASKAAFPEELEERYLHKPSGLFRGRKASLYEGGHRVPYILHWPARVKAGTIRDELIGLQDFYGTFAELTGAGVQDDAGEDSISILPLWLGLPGSQGRDTIVTRDFAGRLSIRSRDWKLIMGRNSKQRELYNLAIDPSESVNRISREPAIAASLQNQLTHIVLSGRSTPGPAARNNTPGGWKELYWIGPGAAGGPS